MHNTSGWYLSTNAKKRHYYIVENNQWYFTTSLCRRWILAENIELTPDDGTHDGNCVTCEKRLRKLNGH